MIIDLGFWDINGEYQEDLQEVSQEEFEDLIKWYNWLRRGECNAH